MVQLWRRYRLLITVITAVILSLWLYWPTLSLPLIYDTLLHIRITGNLNFSNVWIPTEAFGFYRPLTFFPMLIVKSLFGYYPAWLMHGLNVAQHGLNVTLLIWLSWRLWHNGRFALTTGLLFALFPFSYQAIAVYGHNVHPTTTGLLLAGLHTYLTAIRGDGKRPFAWLITLFFFILSLLSHESAILFGGFAALIHWNEQKVSFHTIREKGWGNFIRDLGGAWLIFLLLGILYLIGYQFLPLTRPPDSGSLNLDSFAIRILYLLQAAIYPLAWLGNKLPFMNNNGQSIVLGGTAVMLLWIIWTARDSRSQRPLLLAIGWLTASYLLISIPLTTNYLLHGPRLLYLGSVGVAILWAALLERLWQIEKWGVVRWAATAVFIFILLSSGQFVRQRLVAYQQLTHPVEIIANVMADYPPNASLILVNTPQWLDPANNQYPIGIEFVSMLGNYLFIEELIADNLRDSHPVWAITIPERLADTPYQYGIHAQSDPTEIDPATPEQHLFLTLFNETAPQTIHTGWIGAETNAAPIADFNEYRLLDGVAELCGGETAVTLTWQFGNQPPSPTSTIFVQALDSNGQLLSQADGPPLGISPGAIPIDDSRTIIDLRQLETANQPPETLLVGVYNYLNGERFPALDAEGKQLTDNAFRIPVTQLDTSLCGK